MALTIYKCTVGIELLSLRIVMSIKCRQIMKLPIMMCQNYVSYVSEPGELNLKALWPSDCDLLGQSELLITMVGLFRIAMGYRMKAVLLSR